MAQKLVAEVGVINRNGSCGAYANARLARKKVSAAIYLLMCVDANQNLEPGNALTGALLPTSKIGYYLNRLHKARLPRRLPASCCAALCCAVLQHR